MFKTKLCLYATVAVSVAVLPAACLFGEAGPVPPATAAGVSSSSSNNAAQLPDAPSPQPNGESRHGAGLVDDLLNEVDPGYDGVAGKWDVTINHGERVQPFTALDKIHYAWTEENDPASLFTASLAAGYEHLRDSDPHFGTDSAGFGERLGAAAFRQGVNRMFGDGFLPALTHEDPRYYRIGEGSITHRGLRSVEQTLIRHRDNGTVGINYSGLAGHAMADGLPITFYPQVSAKADVALKGFGTSLAADAGLKLVREFLPDLFQSMGFHPKN
jgi:hypothetical protein